jgi:hypothetical protein
VQASPLLDRVERIARGTVPRASDAATGL